jgi:hypothetical protein
MINKIAFGFFYSISLLLLLLLLLLDIFSEIEINDFVELLVY